jgi:DNA-binding GntR family transcriptional regulator
MMLGRANISDDAASAVREMIVDGALRDGDRINEVHLAAKLGVSRTPLREALNRLVAEGALIARPRRGLFVKPLTVEEFDGLYDMRPLLDPEALRLSGVPDERRLGELERLNEKLTHTRGAEAIDLDDRWHLLLVSRCANQALLELIELMMARTRRYELALMRETESVSDATDAHAIILKKLRARDIDGACVALKRNLESGKPPILSWLKARERSFNI